MKDHQVLDELLPVRPRIGELVDRVSARRRLMISLCPAVVHRGFYRRPLIDAISYDIDQGFRFAVHMILMAISQF